MEGTHEEFENFNRALKNYANALERNRDMVRELLPYVFSTIASLSVFDVKLDLQSSTIQEFVNNLMRISNGFKNEFTDITHSQQNNLDSIVKASDLLSVGADTAKKLDQSMIEEKHMIENIQLTLNDLSQKSKEMGGEVDELISLISTITDTIGGIKNIADHITLVALNASVEAARAGEAGKGFSVIASEVRTLSENTKNLLNKLNGLLDKVADSSDNSKAALDLTFEGISKISDMSKTLLTSTITNNDYTAEVSHNIGETYDFMQSVSAGTRKTADAIEKSTGEVDHIISITQDLAGVADEIAAVSKSFQEMMDGSGEMMTSLSGKIMQTRQLGISNDEFIEIIEKAIVAHRGWVKTASDMADEMHVLPLQTNEHKCGFGYYYYSMTPVAPQILSIWREIEPIHHSLHNLGHSIIDSIRADDQFSAGKHVRLAVDYSEQIIHLFEKIINETKNMGRVSIFK